jgi:hypothetical protein
LANAADGCDPTSVSKDAFDVEVEVWLRTFICSIARCTPVGPATSGVGMVDPAMAEDVRGDGDIAGVPHIETAFHYLLGCCGDGFVHHRCAPIWVQL